MNQNDKKTLLRLRKLRSDRLNLAEHRLAAARHEAMCAADEETSAAEARRRMRSDSAARAAGLNAALVQGSGHGRSRILQWRIDHDRIKHALADMEDKLERAVVARKAKDEAVQHAQARYRDQALDVERLLLLLERVRLHQ